MTIEILYFPDCPNYLPAVENVQHALHEEGVSAEVRHVQVVDAATAREMSFLGSPSVRINGVDIEPSARSGGASGLCCRTYRSGSSPEGAPSVALIREAIRELTNPEKSDCCVQNNRHTGRGTILASAAALASAVAASSCCLPLLPFVAAAGLAGGSALFTAVRPYLLGVSVLLIGFAFLQSHRAKQCNCRPSKLSTVVLWISATVVALMIFFPQAVAELFAGA
jgi:hypothetical protein